MKRTKPFNVEFKYNPFQDLTEILVDQMEYDSIAGYFNNEERKAVKYTVLKKLYSEDVAKENLALRRENEQLRKIVAVYEQLTNTHRQACGAVNNPE